MDKQEKIRLIVEKIVVLFDYVYQRQREQFITLIYAQIGDLLEDIL